MSEKLLNMTLEELWRLFPVRLVPHDGNWSDHYADMEKKLTERLKDRGLVRIGHIGSTAVPKIKAKPIVDILVEISSDRDINEVARAIEDIGFLKMSQSGDRASFNYGYTDNGYAEKVYHLHLRFAGDNAELYFRDYLIDNPEIAAEYEDLKLRLSKKFEFDRDAYTQAKTDFITFHTNRAKVAYSGRYE